MLSKEDMVALVEPMLAGSGTELVLVQVVPGQHQTRIRVFIDRIGGVSIEDCAQLSRQIARRLDASPDGAGEYRLEVSSAGMNRPIWTLEHFRRFCGEKVHGEWREPREGCARFSGTIAAVNGEQVEVRTAEGELLTLRVGELAAARVELDPWKGRRRAAGD